MGIDQVPVIETERLVLTPLTVEDADGMVAVYADPRMFEFTGGEPPTPDGLRVRYERLAVGWNHDRTQQWCNWIVRVRGERDPIGAMQATVDIDLAWAEVAWEVGVAHQGHGYAVEAANAMVDALVDAGVGTIRACIHPTHGASAGVAARLGLVPTDEVDDGEIVWAR